MVTHNENVYIANPCKIDLFSNGIPNNISPITDAFAVQCKEQM